MSLQISELSFQSHSLEDENEMLTQKNAQNAAGMESMRQQLLELLKETQRSEADHAADRKKVRVVDDGLCCCGAFSW